MVVAAAKSGEEAAAATSICATISTSGFTTTTKGKSRLLTSVSFMLGIANLQMHQMGVKIDLLNEDLEEIYMEQPKGFVAQGKENKVCKLVNTLYGLKQAPKQ
ncbi:hypothetical protein OSB04_007563 [Centaurea solstitialis]|uniref:Reverse transcriptase Ty1/copia-type domain-containing protein n=1 Tax=Centaurea solstitialis TaxID=347529 RepID=A0AA38U4N0_9ASTR|nr:hypothetical protein OSB04_007563 [Centaurea solstitialis]